MAATFGGFTDQQREVLARRMGYTGSMDQFGKFLQSSPAYQQKFVSYEERAKKLIEGEAGQTPFPAPSFAAGGAVQRQIDRSRAKAGLPPQTAIPNAANSVTYSAVDRQIDRSRESVGLPPRSSGTAQSTTVSAAPQSPVPQSVTTQQAQPAAPTTTPAATPTASGTMSANPTSTLSARIFENPTLATPQVKVDEMQVSADQMVSPTSGQVTKSDPVTASQTAPTGQADVPATTPAPQVTTATSASPVASATEGFQAAKGTVSDAAKVEAATALPSANATVQGQLENLMKQFEGGTPPAWAAGAIRNANAIMAQRGLGASSMAGSAVTQAAMESAIEIAARDAATFSQFELTNLNNRQQARLVNAQAFLQMDLANLDAEQQMTMFKSQSIIQSLFTDQAAENASRQFNASSQGQTDQFFANLKSTVAQFNVAQTNAMEQFKAGQKDSVAMFNRQMNDQAEQFNAANRLVIDQSNAEWRRAVTTANNATANEANRTNALNASGMTLAAYNNMMQRERDFYSFAFTAGENAASRANELALSKMNTNAIEKQADKESSSAMWSSLGSLAASLVSKW